VEEDKRRRRGRIIIRRRGLRRIGRRRGYEICSPAERPAACQ
jgi:hypothetical protein